MRSKRVTQKRKVYRRNRVNPELVCGRIAMVSLLLLTLAAALMFAARFQPEDVHGQHAGKAQAFRAAEFTLRAPLFPGEMRSLVEPLPGDATGREAIATSAYSQAYDRLNHALQAHPNQSADELVQKVHQSDPTACPIAWRDGQPSVSLHKQFMSLSQSLDHCADAIEKLHERSS